MKCVSCTFQIADNAKIPIDAPVYCPPLPTNACEYNKSICYTRRRWWAMVGNIQEHRWEFWHCRQSEMCNLHISLVTHGFESHPLGLSFAGALPGTFGATLRGVENVIQS